MKDYRLRKAISAMLLGVVCGAGCFLLIQPRGNLSVVERKDSNTNQPSETSRKEPRQQALLADTTLPLKSKQDFESEAFQMMLESNPVAAFAEIQKLENKSGRERELKTAIKRLVDFDLEAAKSLLAATQDTWLRNEISAAIASVWGKRHPQAALAFSGLSSKERFYWVNGVMNAWAEADPVGAAIACKNLSAGRDRNAAAMHVADQWKRQNLKAAADFVFNIPSGDEKDSFDGDTIMAGVMGTWTETDVPCALDWLKTLPDGSRKDTAAHAALVVMTTSDISAAKEFLAELSIEQIRRSVNSLAGRWAVDSPFEAGEWAASLQDEKAQINALKGVMGYWAQTDPAGAAQWLEKQPTGAMRDKSTQSLASMINELNPNQGMKLAASIGDTKLRARVLRSIATNWLIREPAAATRWIQNAPDISPDLREVLLSEP